MTYRCDWPGCKATSEQAYTDGWANAGGGDHIRGLPDACWFCPKHSKAHEELIYCRHGCTIDAGGNVTFDDYPDLLFGGTVHASPDFAWTGKTVEATSKRGEAFIHSYQGVIAEENKDPVALLGNWEGAPGDDDFYIENLTMDDEEFDKLKRQASLAGLSIGDLRDYPSYDSAA